MAAAFFTDKTFRFQRALARNNNREWFTAHRDDYEQHLRQPFLRLITAMQPVIAGISPHYRADPKPMGGSLFRIHRDTRFANDKTPYKIGAGARFFHERRRHVEAPSFYLHVQPGHCFLGAGLWHPEQPTVRRVRAFLFENPDAWTKVVHSKPFKRSYSMGSESLVRVPQGYPADHPLIEDIKRKSFVATITLDDAQVTGPNLLKLIDTHFKAISPVVDYLCAALDLEF